MRLPPRWLRRILLGPAVVVGVLAAVGFMPVWILIALFMSRMVPGKWRIFRVAWFLFLYLAVEAMALTALFGLWVGSGFGWKVKTEGFQNAHYSLLGWVLRRVMHSAMYTFRLTLVTDGPAPSTIGARGRRPVLVLSRHAGPGDSFLLLHGIVNRYHRRPRVVLKDFLQWDPAVDVMLNRLPVAFVPTGRQGRDELLDAISGLTRDMGADDAFVMFPEGANYTVNRHKRAIKKLREIGRPDLAERAEALEITLPPRTTGVKSALGAAPDKSDVVFVGHAGLESFVTPGDIWRAIPMDTHVAVKMWHVPYEELPSDDELETWMFDTWRDIDAWIAANLSDTGELAFDDPDAY